MKKYITIFSVLLLLTACQAEAEQVGAVSQEPLKSLPFLVVDLDGDGFEYIPLEESEVYFDVDGDGLAERTQWVHPDDGFLYVISRQEDRVLDSVYSRVIAFFVDLMPKIQQYDKNKDSVYNSKDSIQLPRNKIYQELDFLIVQDKILQGIPSSKDEDIIPCSFDSFSFSSSDEMFLSCLSGRKYKVEERIFEYEDSNVRWKTMCDRLKKNYYHAIGSKKDYLKYCKQPNIKNGDMK